MKSEERYLIALGNLQSMAIDNTKGSRAVEICVNDIQNYVKLKDNIIKEVREYIEEHSYDYRVGGIAKVNGKELLEILDKINKE